MIKPKPHSLAAEVDRTLKLSLNNGRFNRLVTLISGQEDRKKYARDLMAKKPQEVLSLIGDRSEHE